MGRRSRKPTPAERVRSDTSPGGVPLGTGIDDSDAYTVARCGECGELAIKGGPIVPDEQMCRERWDVCAFGDGWSWCHKDGGKFKRR